MGKKAVKKTRWRTLTLNGHQSDSEESSAPSSISNQNHHIRNYPEKYYSAKFSNYSSQSTPTKKYQNDSSKTTRSNSTTSEHKTTFNEDEYTRITTPRQDVLFKKGYLNKPKNYQTQTSTGTSSTANSTSTCTPDHQSADGTEGTDLEYESQFVFPNGFIDQNGIYYINSYEPFPFVVYNAPICYQEPYTHQERTKRYSTDSGADSVGTHNEEAVQNGEADYCNNATASDNSNEEPRRLKKKRRRKISRTKDGDNSCDTDDSTSDVVFKEEQVPPPDEAQTLLLQGLTKPSEEDDEAPAKTNGENPEDTTNNKYPLKPDAEEFVPRIAYPQEIPYEPPNNIQYINFAPGYIPVPYHNPAFLPPGIPVNYVPMPEAKFVNVIVPNEPRLVEEVQPLESPKKVTPKVEEDQVQPARRGRYLTNGVRSKPQERPRITTQPQNNRKPLNYSATVKRNDGVPAKPPATTCNRYEKSLEPVKQQKQRTANQWIPVVSSKKRKRKGVNEEEVAVFEEKPAEQDDNFESFDVNLLEDVVVAPVKTEEVVEIPNGVIEEEVQAVEESVPKISKTKEKKKKIKKVTVKKIMILDDYQPKEPEEPKVTQPVEESPPQPLLQEPQEPQEKKKKKKKKTVKLQSISSSTTTLSNFEDSYDFLLESSILEDSDQKTNVEMSEAFDIVIQKGMFNSLEEKIKALNIGASEDGFFKKINFVTFKTPPTPSKHFFTSQQFDKLFQKEIFKANSEPPNEPPQTAIFLENPTVNEIINEETSPEPPNPYPITQAVKNWLTKTRESTPDVEPLNQVINKGPGPRNAEEDVTLWSVSPQNSQEEDLLDLWESDPPVVNGVENGEEAIEVYESKYGKNEDYLRIKGEVEEQKVGRNFPRHGNLPYRAICCNIM